MIDVCFDPIMDEKVPFPIEHGERCACPPVLTEEGRGGKGERGDEREGERHGDGRGVRVEKERVERKRRCETLMVHNRNTMR